MPGVTRCWGVFWNMQWRQLELYPAQEAAILELYEEKNVILNTPTGSGKSLVAAALHFKGAAQGRRSVYTCPIKALVNEKWLALCRVFGPENVGLSTGDASVNRDAPILCCTAEILANIALREGADAKVDDVIMDEFHYYADRERGVAWQTPLLTLPQARFLLMSATLGETAFFEEELTRLNGRETVTVHVGRIVRCRWSIPMRRRRWRRRWKGWWRAGRHRCTSSISRRLEAAQSAQDFMSMNVCTREEKAAIAHALEGFKFSSPYGPEIKQVAAAWDRPASRRAAAEVSRAGRATRAKGPAQSDLRHGHARRGHQRADPDGAVSRSCASLTGRRRGF